MYFISNEKKKQYQQIYALAAIGIVPIDFTGSYCSESLCMKCFRIISIFLFFKYDSFAMCHSISVTNWEKCTNAH